MMTTTSPPPASTSSRASFASISRTTSTRPSSSAAPLSPTRLPRACPSRVASPSRRLAWWAPQDRATSRPPARPSDTPPPRAPPRRRPHLHRKPPPPPAATSSCAPPPRRDVRRLGSPPERPLGARRRARSRLRLARRALRGTRGSRASGVPRQTPGRGLRPPHAHHRARARRRPVVRTPRAGPGRPQTLPRRRRRLRRRSRQIRTRVPFPRLAQQPSVGVRGPERLEQRDTGLRRGDSTERRNRSRAAVRAQQSRKREIVRRGLRRRVGGLRRLRRRVSGDA